VTDNVVQLPRRDLDEPAENFTETGNGRRLVATYGDVFRWVPSWGSWLVYDGARWARDEHGQMERFAKAIADDIAEEALRLTIDSDRKLGLKWALASENAGRISAAIALARSEPGISIPADSLDADPWLLNVRNGTVDLHTGRLRPHRPGDLITKLAPVEHDPDATCPAWDRFLATVLPDDELRAYVRQAVGYSLTGTVTEQTLLFTYGTGANGKTTMLNAVLAVLGDYANQSDPTVITAADSHPTGIARLQGARMVVASELDDGRRLAEATVKSLTGGDRVVARLMHRDFFEFNPTWSFWLSANHRPIITGTDHGIWRRVKVIPFTVTVAAEDQDPDLPAKLEAEAAGILNWALAGCLAWQRQRLEDPPAVCTATADYRADMDAIGTFLDEACDVEPAARESATVLYRRYQGWCDDAGERPLTQRRFGSALTERGFDRSKSSTIVWSGLKVKTF
jgi:putative DNA primase/helicase